MDPPKRIFVDRKGQASPYPTSPPGQLQRLARLEERRRGWRVIVWCVVGGVVFIGAAAVVGYMRR